jgi:tetratricopeptide (TPR) repeat protein
MASRSISVLFSNFLCLSLVMTITLAPCRAQTPDYTEDEYKQFQAIDAEADIVKKTDMAVAFIKAKPKSSLSEHLIGSIPRAIAQLGEEQKWSQIIACGDKFLTVVPDDKITISALTSAYWNTKNMKGFTTFGEKAYAATPNEQMAYSLAIAYLELQNDAKFVQWGEKIPATSPQFPVLVAQLMKRTSGTKQDQYARSCIKVLPTAAKPEGMSDKDWKDTLDISYAMAYGVLGASAYQNRSYGPAIEHLTNALKYNKANETAYYFLGMSYWRTNKLDLAMLNFAKAYLLRGSTSTQAKKYLEELWSNSHRGSLAGMERVVQKAQQDLK